jgi:hypothetical protein
MIDWDDVSITEPTDEQRRKNVHARAKALLERLNKERPAMLRDMERRRRADEELERFEQQQLQELRQLASGNWPQYNSWRGEKF